MNITGCIAEFPLPELLQFLDRRQGTGCLRLEVFSDYYAELHPQNYSIWLSEGQIIAVHRHDHESDVYTLAAHKEWISTFSARKLRERAPKNIAAGLYLESQGVLNFSQLRLLFFNEVVYRVESFCAVKKANFNFQTSANLPLHCMTGLHSAASKVAQQGLRMKNSNDTLQNIKNRLLSPAI